jgi:hypothetical protein
MKSKTTAIWFVLAAALFAGVWFCQKYLQPAGPEAVTLLAGLRATDLTAISVSPAGALEIAAVRTNGAWQLEKPVAYPAQSAAIESLVDALVRLTPQRLTASDLNGRNADAEYGFDNPQYTLDLAAGDQTWHLRVGKRTAPGDQIFVRVVGLDGAFVTEVGWLQLLPHSASDWRDTALVNAAGCDWIVVTNGGKALEFRRDATNQVWRMIQPLATRADGTRLALALQQLQAGRVQFITDDPRADLSTYGLQPADLVVWLGHGTNFLAAVQIGKNLPDDATKVYARRVGWNSVVAVDKSVFAPWRGPVNSFRDPNLLTLTGPVAQIEVRSGRPEDNFILQRSGAGGWTVVGEKFPADQENVQNFLRLLAGLRISEFVKDAVTAPVLQSFGLTPPSRQIILRRQTGDAGPVAAQLNFGATETNRVLVQRGDEDFVYALKPEDYARLPEAGWEFRDRRIWHFSETNVAQVTVRQNGTTRQLLRTGDGQWSLAEGSQGMIEPPAVEETLHRLGELTAYGWVARNATAPEKYGLNPGNLSLTVELKSGEKLELDFGLVLAQGASALAAVNLDGERWVFVFPPVAYHYLNTYLALPPAPPSN